MHITDPDFEHLEENFFHPCFSDKYKKASMYCVESRHSAAKSLLDKYGIPAHMPVKGVIEQDATRVKFYLNLDKGDTYYFFRDYDHLKWHFRNFIEIMENHILQTDFEDKANAIEKKIAADLSMYGATLICLLDKFPAKTRLDAMVIYPLQQFKDLMISHGEIFLDKETRNNYELCAQIVLDTACNKHIVTK